MYDMDITLHHDIPLRGISSLEHKKIGAMAYKVGIEVTVT